MIESNYEVAQQKALKSNKILLVFLTKKECTYCNKELRKILNSKNITSLIEKKAIFLLVYKAQYESFPRELLYATHYPTLFFLDKYELFSCRALRENINIKDIITCLTPKKISQ